MNQPKQYRKKPVCIEAWQWNGTEIQANSILAWISGGNEELTGGSYAPGYRDVEPELHIATLEDGRNGIARHVASPGDWIIKGVKGEFYPCKPEIFEATYEPA